VEEGIKRVGQCCIAVRDTQGTDEKNPLGYFEVKKRIDAAMRPYIGQYTVVPMPNITHVFYGRDVGYMVEEINLDEETKSISATSIRNEINGKTKE